MFGPSLAVTGEDSYLQLQLAAVFSNTRIWPSIEISLWTLPRMDCLVQLQIFLRRNPHYVRRFGPRIALAMLSEHAPPWTLEDAENQRCAEVDILLRFLQDEVTRSMTLDHSVLQRLINVAGGSLQQTSSS